MWRLGWGRQQLRGSRRHFRLQLRRTCLKVWWTSAPFLLLQSALMFAPNPEKKPEWEIFGTKKGGENWTENGQQKKAINKAWKGSWQAKERLRKVKRENTTEAAVLFNISKSWKNLRTSRRMVNTFNFFRIFGLLKFSAPNPHTQASPSIWVGLELILFCCRMTGCRLDIQAAFFRPSRRGNGFKIFLQPLPRKNIGIPGTHNATHHLPASLIKKNRTHGLPTETEEAY